MKITKHFFLLSLTFFLIFSAMLLASFEFGTKVVTPIGLVSIEDLRVGSVITGYNPINGTFPDVIVREISSHPTDHVYVITTEKEAIYVSSDQLFCDPSLDDFIEAKQLTGNKILLTKDLDNLSCIKVDMSNKKTTFYDITLDAPHLFFTSEAQILTHNAATAILAAAEIFIDSAITFACLVGIQKVFTDLNQIKSTIKNDIIAYLKKWDDINCPYDKKISRTFISTPPSITGITLDSTFYNHMLLYPFQYGPLCPSGSMTNTGDVECTLRILRFMNRQPGGGKGIAYTNYFGWDVIGRSILRRNEPSVQAFIKDEDQKQLTKLNTFIQSCSTSVTSKLFKVHPDVEEEWSRIRPPKGCFDQVIYGTTFNIHAIYRMVQKKIPPSLVLNVIKYGKSMQAHQPLRLICFDQKENIAVVVHKQFKTIMNVGHYRDLISMNTPDPDNKETDIDSLSPNNINHIKDPKHKWEQLVPDGNWDGIKKIMKDVMQTGGKKAYKKDVFLKTKVVNGHTVEVTYVDRPTGERKIGNGWVK